MKRLLLIVALWVWAAAPAFAAYPAAWPGDGQWIPYTYGGDEINDQDDPNPVGDPSNGGANVTPNGIDVSSEEDASGVPTKPSVLFYYDAVNQVVFFRIRILDTPRQTTGAGQPVGSFFYCMIIDSNGDGYRNFVATVNGDSDQVEIYYGVDQSQKFSTASLVASYALPSTPTSTGTITEGSFEDFGPFRSVDIGSSTEFFVDFQVKLSDFKDTGGTQKIFATTPMGLAFGTATSNSDPFQKDFAFEGAFDTSDSAPVPFGDILTLAGGISQSPITVGITKDPVCPPTVSVVAIDTMATSGGAAASTVDYVELYYQPDDDGDGTPNAGSTPTLIGTDTQPEATDLGKFTFTWNIDAVPNGSYVLFAKAFDTSVPANVSTSSYFAVTQTCHTGQAVSGYVYGDTDQDGTKDSGEAGLGTAGLFVKVRPAAGGNATSAASVDATTGFYQFVSVDNGSYTLFLDDNSTLTDTTPFTPTGRTRTEPASGDTLAITMGGAALTDRNFGYFALGVDVSGTVYADVDHNEQKGTGETGTGVAGLVVKVIPSSGGNAISSGAVTAVTGAYTVPSVPAGTYILILDDNATLTDITPSAPTGWIGTENPDQQSSPLTVGQVAVTDRNFGLFNGSRLTGTVFQDHGTGGGTANNGVKDGTETGISGVLVSVKNAAGTTEYDNDTTPAAGTYTLFVPASLGAVNLLVTETQPAAYISTGGSAGTTGGTYDRATDRVTFAYNPAANVAAFTGVDFAEAGVGVFIEDNQVSGDAGAVVFFPHQFTAGGAGSVTFGITRTSEPAGTEFQSILYRDTNGNGVLDAGEVPLITALALTAGEVVHLLIKEFIPTTVTPGARDQLSVTATFDYTGASPALQASYVRTDLLTVGPAASVLLQKIVDAATASSNDVIEYTVTYTNTSSESVTSFVINDATPAYTTFVSAPAPTLPAGLTGCAITAPTVGSSGSITWTFTGELRPGTTGTVTFKVKVQ